LEKIHTDYGNRYGQGRLKIFEAETKISDVLASSAFQELYPL
jgi:hypothetical protein